MDFVHNNSDRDVALAIQKQFPDTKLDDLEKVIKRYRGIEAWPKITNFSEESYYHLQDIMIDYGALIVGPSGCGKSTILSILAGLEKKSDGDINLNNDLKVGYMLQSDSLFSWRTILENCLIGLEIENNLTKENVDYVVNLLKVYGLEEFMNKYPDSLSGGMRQRVVCI